MQYLTARYEKGKMRVGEYMDKHHFASTYRQLNLAHGDVVSKQASLGPSTFLGSLNISWKQAYTPDSIFT